MDLKPHKKAGIIAAAVILFGAAFYAAFHFSEDNYQDMPVVAEAITFEGVPDGTTYDAYMNVARRADPVPVEKNTLTWDYPLSEKTIKRAHELEVALRIPDQRVRDLSWSMDKRGHNYNITFKGFTPAGKISFILNDQRVFTTNFDWAGKIEIPVLLTTNTDNKACVEVYDEKTPLKICHSITRGEA